MSDCLFCRIVAGEIPSRRVFEDDVAYAFLDIAPWQRGHSLVVPKRHASDALSDPRALAEIAPAVVSVGNLLRTRLQADGVNLLSSVGATAGQEIFHLHVHVVPRYADSPGLAQMVAKGRELDLDEVARLVAG